MMTTTAMPTFTIFMKERIRLLVSRVIVARCSCVFEFTVVGHHSPPNLAPDSRKRRPAPRALA